MIGKGRGKVFGSGLGIGDFPFLLFCGRMDGWTDLFHAFTRSLTLLAHNICLYAIYLLLARFSLFFQMQAIVCRGRSVIFGLLLVYTNISQHNPNPIQAAGKYIT
jgi:hypothetical protein